MPGGFNPYASMTNMPAVPMMAMDPMAMSWQSQMANMYYMNPWQMFNMGAQGGMQTPVPNMPNPNQTMLFTFMPFQVVSPLSA